MAKKAATTHMNSAEQLAGTIFFVVYLLVLPLLTDRLFLLAEVLFNARMDGDGRNLLYYYMLTGVTLLIFHSFLAGTTKRFFDNLNRAFTSLFLGLLVFYGANELVCRASRLLLGSGQSLNDTVIAAQVASAPRTTALIIVFLAPFVEETLFRGLVFGCFKEKSRVVAYAASSLLFAFLYAWTFAVSARDPRNFIQLVRYLVPGLVFAWAFDRSGTLWTSVLLHAAVNALALWTA